MGCVFMNEYKISDYGIFNDAVSTSKTMNESILEAKNTIDDCKTYLSNEAVFKGPIADQALEGCATVANGVGLFSQNCDVVEKYLTETATNYNNGDKNAKDIVLLSTYSSNESTTNVTGKNILDGNVIDASNPVGTGTKYNLSEDDLEFLGYVASSEQGSVDGAKLELSLMANLYEENKDNYSSVRDYVENSGWFGSSYGNEYSNPGDDYVAAATDVMVNGNRYLASNVVEHDCLSDIESCSTGSVDDRSCYVPGETVLKNVYGAEYVFVGFAPNEGDPFGYLIN